jgi:hypothetical protein
MVRLDTGAADIDRLITLDINGRGVIQELYSAACKKIKRPLVLAAAETLVKTVSPGDVVFIATGWPDRPWITPEIGELDGPPGVALLACSLHCTLGAIPIFLIEDATQGMEIQVQMEYQRKSMQPCLLCSSNWS